MYHKDSKFGLWVNCIETSDKELSSVILKNRTDPKLHTRKPRPNDTFAIQGTVKLCVKENSLDHVSGDSGSNPSKATNISSGTLHKLLPISEVVAPYL